MSTLRAAVIDRLDAILMQFEEMEVERPAPWRENFLFEALQALTDGRYVDAEKALDRIDENPSAPDIGDLDVGHEAITIAEARTRLDALKAAP